METTVIPQIFLGRFLLHSSMFIIFKLKCEFKIKFSWKWLLSIGFESMSYFGSLEIVLGSTPRGLGKL
jgi:hypothetical protein